MTHAECLRAYLATLRHPDSLLGLLVAELIRQAERREGAGR